MLCAGKAFACVLVEDREPAPVCLAFENYETIWEAGGVVTSSTYHRQGLTAKVVRTALVELARRRLVPRYQVEERNVASIQLARAVGQQPFLTITHQPYGC